MSSYGAAVKKVHSRPGQPPPALAIGVAEEDETILAVDEAVPLPLYRDGSLASCLVRWKHPALPADLATGCSRTVSIFARGITTEDLGSKSYLTYENNILREQEGDIHDSIISDLRNVNSETRKQLAPEAASVGLEVRLVGNDSGEKVVRALNLIRDSWDAFGSKPKSVYVPRGSLQHLDLILSLFLFVSL